MFYTKPEIQFNDKRARFSSDIVLDIYVETVYVLRIYKETGYIQNMYKKKIYCELLVLLSMLFVQLFVHTRECDCSTLVGVETVLSTILTAFTTNITILINT